MHGYYTEVNLIPVQNYKVVVPFIPDVRFTHKKRLTVEGDRKELRYSVHATNLSVINLPWKPTAPEWVEIYVDGFRLVNSRVTSQSQTVSTGGTLYEQFNIIGTTITFTSPVNGEILAICDTLPTHHYAAVILNPKNHQALIEKTTVANLAIDNTPVIGGYQQGFNYHVSFEPGPKYEANSYVIISGNSPSNFNGNFKVRTSNLGSVEFTANMEPPNRPGISTIHTTGFVSGFAEEFVWYKNITNALYAEPVVLTQPMHGYARLTGDRQSIAYVPNLNYVGNDTFSWTLITQHGQIGTPKCAYFRITKI